jgi:hypothetical protein
MINGIKQSMMAAGADSVTATEQAYGALFGMVQREALMLGFVRAFRLLGFLFFAMIPLVFLMKKPKHQGGGGAAMH